MLFLFNNEIMKKILLLLTTILLTIGCNQKQKEQVVSQESNPQLTAAEIRNQEIQDSLKKVRNDSLALIAWGDAKFQIGDKMIAIELGELRSDVRFYYHIYIDNSKFPKKKHVMTEKEKREEQKQKEETEKIRNNSF